MQNFLNYLTESHMYIFTIWLALIYFFGAHYLKKIYIKLDKYVLFNNFKKKKNLSEFDILDSKDYSLYSKEDLKIIEHRKQTLIFQLDLGIDEKNLNILRYLNLFENSSEALYLYKNCKNLLIFDEQTQQFTIKEIINSESKCKKINWIWNIGILINFIFILFIIFEDKLKSYSGNLGCLLSVVFLFVLLTSFIVFKISRHFEKSNDAKKLLKLSRIEIGIDNE